VLPAVKLLKLLLALFKIVPPTDVTDNNLPVMEPTLLVPSSTVPVEVKVTLLVLPAFNAPVTVMLPALFTVTSPEPVCETPVTANEAMLFFKLIMPLPLLVALKLETLFTTLFNAVPVAELVVSKPPVIKPAAASLIAAPAVKFTPPVVVILPAFIRTLPVAFALIKPDVLLAVALKRMSLLVPVVLNAMPPEPVTVIALPMVSKPLEIKVTAPPSVVIGAVLVVNVLLAPVLVTATTPLPVWLTPVIFKLEPFCKVISPPTLLVALKLVTVLFLIND
jgi:hypothetical protein